MQRNVLAFFLWGLPVASASATDYRCQPIEKNYCSRGAACSRETEGFQHAEAFFYSSDRAALGACLWTNCYSGLATRYVDEKEQITLIGQLDPEHSPEMYPPMLISMTVDQNLNFTAISQFSGTGVTLAQGQCVAQSLRDDG